MTTSSTTVKGDALKIVNWQHIREVNWEAGLEADWFYLRYPPGPRQAAQKVPPVPLTKQRGQTYTLDNLISRRSPLYFWCPKDRGQHSKNLSSLIISANTFVSLWGSLHCVRNPRVAFSNAKYQFPNKFGEIPAIDNWASFQIKGDVRVEIAWHPIFQRNKREHRFWNKLKLEVALNLRLKSFLLATITSSLTADKYKTLARNAIFIFVFALFE